MMTLQPAIVMKRLSRKHLGVPFLREFALGIDSEDDPNVINLAGYKGIMDVHWVLRKVHKDRSS